MGLGRQVDVGYKGDTPQDINRRVKEQTEKKIKEDQKKLEDERKEKEKSSRR